MNTQLAVLVGKILLQIAVFVLFMATMFSDISLYENTTLLLLFLIYLNTGGAEYS